MNAYEIEKTLETARAVANDLDLRRADHQVKLQRVIFQMLGALLQDAADRAAEAALNDNR